jgi:hypothetical protein
MPFAFLIRPDDFPAYGKFALAVVVCPAQAADATRRPLAVEGDGIPLPDVSP